VLKIESRRWAKSWEPPEPSHAWVDWEALSLAVDCDEVITLQPVTGAARAALSSKYFLLDRVREAALHSNG